MTESTNECPIGEMLDRQLVEAEIHNENSFQSVSTPSPVSELSNSPGKENRDPNKINEAPELWTGVGQKFEDTLNQNDREVFLRILHSLIAQGEDKEMGITHNIIKEVTEGRPPAWLHVISARLKGLILSEAAYKERHQTKNRALKKISSKNIKLTDKPPRAPRNRRRGHGWTPKIRIRKGIRRPIRLQQHNRGRILILTCMKQLLIDLIR